MLDREKPDLAVVAPFFFLQSRIACECLERGIHVFVEKPMSVSFEQLERLRRAYALGKADLCPMLTSRYLPSFHAAWRALRDGLVGRASPHHRAEVVQAGKPAPHVHAPRHLRRHHPLGGDPWHRLDPLVHRRGHRGGLRQPHGRWKRRTRRDGKLGDLHVPPGQFRVCNAGVRLLQARPRADSRRGQGPDRGRKGRAGDCRGRGQPLPPRRRPAAAGERGAALAVPGVRPPPGGGHAAAHHAPPTLFRSASWRCAAARRPTRTPRLRQGARHDNEDDWGSTDREITRIGLGTWAIGGAGWKYGWGSQDDKDSVAVIHEALDLGINWIDTAAVYGLGHSEEVVGRALAGTARQGPPRDQVRTQGRPRRLHSSACWMRQASARSWRPASDG